MTIDEAIKHCEEVARLNRETTVLGYNSVGLQVKPKDECIKCAEEHEQLAEWLKDYKRLLEDRPQGDLTSRRVLKNLIGAKSIIIKFEKEKRGEWRYSSGVLLSDIYKTIDNAPTVEQELYINAADYNVYLEGYKQGKKDFERPQGEWIIDGHHIRCNKCNEYICAQDREGCDIPNNYCPNCGAQMKGGDEE